MSDRMSGLRGLGAVALGAALAAALPACEGENLFNVGRVGPPLVVELSVPAAIRSSQVLDVRVRAIGEIRVDSVHVRIRGAFSEDQGRLIIPSSQDIVTDFSFTVPEETIDTILVVQAIAVDARGNVSPVETDTVRVLDGSPPKLSVGFETGPVGFGQNVDIQVRAADNVGLSRVGYRVMGPEGDTVRYELVATTGAQLDTTFVYTVSSDAGVGNFAVEAVAVDVEGNTAVEKATDSLEVVFIDEEPPAVEIFVPLPDETFLITDSVFVAVALSDNDAVAQLRLEGLALRGNPDLGSQIVVPRFQTKEVSFNVAPSDTVVARFLSPVVENTSEVVHLVATALDRQGNSTADTVAIFVIGDDEPPTVAIRSPQDPVTLPFEDSLLVEVSIQDFWGTSRVRLEGLAFRGDPDLGTGETVERLEALEVEFALPPRDTVITRYLFPTGDGAEETVFVIVTAADVWDNVGADTVRIQLRSPVPPVQSASSARPATVLGGGPSPGLLSLSPITMPRREQRRDGGRVAVPRGL